MFKASHTISPDVAATLIDAYVERAISPLMRAGRLDNNEEFAVSAAVLAADLPFAECVLLRKAYVLRDGPADPKYLAHAVSKAEISFRTGLTGRFVPAALRRTGETKYAGAVVFEGFVVAVSAFREFYDEGFAGQIAYELWCESVRVIAEAGDFLGD